MRGNARVENVNRFLCNGEAVPLTDDAEQKQQSIGTRKNAVIGILFPMTAFLRNL